MRWWSRLAFTYLLSVLSGISLLQAQDTLLLADTLRAVEVHGELSSPSLIFDHRTWTLDSIPVADVNELLSEQSGLYVKDYGPGSISTLNYRGAGANQHRIFWNGMPIEAPSVGLVDLSTLPTALISSAEMYTGPAGLLLGSGAMGSALLLESGTSAKAPTWSFGHQLIPYLDRVDTRIAHSGSSKGWTYALRFFRMEAENKFEYLDDLGFAQETKTREQSAERMYGAAADIDFRHKDGTQTSLSTQYVDINREIAAPVGIQVTDQRQKDANARYLLRHKRHALGGESEWGLGATQEEFLYSDKDKNIHSPLESNTIHLRWASRWHLNQHWTLRTRLEHLNQSVSTPNYVERAEQNTSGAYGELQARYEHTSLLVGFRQELLDGEMTPWSGSLAASYTIEPRLQAYVRAGKTFRAPTMNERFWRPGGVPDISAEQGWMLEAGVEYQDEIWSSQVGYFRNAMESMILWAPTDGGLWSAVNLSSVISHGLEWIGELNMGKKLSIDAQVLMSSNTEWRIGEEFNSRGLYSLPYHPEFVGQATVRYTKDALTVFSRLRYQGLTYADRLNNERIDENYPIDLGLTYWVNKEQAQMSVGFTLHNLLDQSYDIIKGRPMPGRYLAMNFNFSIP